MKAAIYARFSTDRQSESSIADQFRVCTEYADRVGLSIGEQFEDQGISGAAIGNRPGVQQMLAAAQSGRFGALLVMDLTRLSRSQADLNKMIDRLVARGIRVVGVQDGYDSARKGHKLQAGLSGIIGEAFREMVRDKTHAALASRARDRRPTGGKCYGYRNGEIDQHEAAIVREVFEQFSQGESCRTIAARLNARGVPSPGSTWARRERRCSGWMGSAIRAMLRNERYKGTVHWNVSEWVKDPDSGKRLRRSRPRSEWITHQVEALRIVDNELFRRAQRRTRLGDDGRMRSGGRPRYLFSGLLTCAECGAHYTIASKHSYACSSYINGKACANNIRVRRDQVEKVLLAPIRDELLASDRVERMAREMQRDCAARTKILFEQAVASPRELLELDARLKRLRARVVAGDPDMTADELQAAIERAEAKRGELLSAAPSAKCAATIMVALPRAADLYRRQIDAGLHGRPRDAAAARVLLRELFGGKVPLKRQGGELWAQIALRPEALLRRAEGTDGSGGSLPTLSTALPSVRYRCRPCRPWYFKRGTVRLGGSSRFQSRAFYGRKPSSRNPKRGRPCLNASAHRPEARQTSADTARRSPCG